MPLTGYLKVPDIDGESLRAEHEDEIDVHAIQWGIAQAASPQVGRGRSQSRAQVAAMSMNKFYDASSPYLALACMQGKSFDEIVLTIRKDSGEAHLDYLIVTMTNCAISSYAIVSTADESQMIEETIDIVCEKINIKYTIQEDDHSAGAEHEIEYDIAAGV